MLKKIELCIFDFDGLLVNTEEEMWTVNAKIASKKITGKEIPYELLRKCMGMCPEEEAKLFKEELGNDFPIDDYFKELYELVYEFAKDFTPTVKKGAFKLLNHLKENNIKCGLSTGSPKSITYPFLERTNLVDCFDHIVCKDDIKNGKPNPEIFLKNIEYFNIDKKNSIVFEDGQAGCEACYNASIPLIIVPDLGYFKQRETDYAIKVLNSLDEAIPIIDNINKQ